MPTDPTRRAVENLFFLQRVANGMSADARALLRDLFDDIAAQLARIDPTAPGAARYRRQRLEKLLGAIEPRVGQTYANLLKGLRNDLARLGAQQGEWATDQLQASIGAAGVDLRPGRLGVNFWKSIIDTDPFRGDLLKDWAKGQERATVDAVRRQVQLGMAQNETIDDLVRRIRGRSVGVIRENGRIVGHRFSGGVLDTSTRHAEALVRTAVNDIANRAHIETWRENQDIAKEYEYVATLDSRTTLICASLDGRRFRLDDDSAPRPPQHWQCRSVTVPVVDWEGLGVEPPEPGTRASVDGPVPATTDYEGWLRRQPKGVQDEILGPGRAKLFREGRVTLRDMVRQDGGVVRLDELRGE